MKITLPKFILTSFLSLICGLLVNADGVRSWTNNTGVVISAQLVEVKDGKVKLLKNGNSYTLSMDTLSSVDQNYIKQWVSKKTKNSEKNVSEQKLKVSKKGKLLYETNFENTDVWRVSSGEWVCKDNAISATQDPKKRHQAHMVIKQPKPVNVIIECEVYLGEGNSVEFTIDDAPRKLGRIGLTPTTFKGIQTHRSKDHVIKKKFTKVATKIEKNKWHHVTIEMIGNQIVGSFKNHTVSSIDDIWAGKPKRLGLLVNGGPAKFRNLKMWAALPKE